MSVVLGVLTDSVVTSGDGGTLLFLRLLLLELDLVGMVLDCDNRQEGSVCTASLSSALIYQSQLLRQPST